MEMMTAARNMNFWMLWWVQMVGQVSAEFILDF